MSHTMTIPNFSPGDISDSGQVFRMTHTGDAEWTLCAGSDRLVITVDNESAVTWRLLRAAGCVISTWRWITGR